MFDIGRALYCIYSKFKFFYLMSKSISYTQQAHNFAAKYNLTMSCTYVGYHFIGDPKPRHVYKVTLKRNGKQMTFNFGSADCNEPSLYSVLVCLTKYEVGTLENFCSEFGYDTDSITANKIYKAVCKEYANLCRLFPESSTNIVWRQLQAIQ